MSKIPPPNSIPTFMPAHIGIVQARFHDELTSVMREEVEEFLRAHGATYTIVMVAGSFEIPYALTQLLQHATIDGAIALGCIIKGETIHNEVVANAVAAGIMNLSIQLHLPIGFGIITADTKQQARKRIPLARHAAAAVLDALHQSRQLSRGRQR